MTIPGHFAKTPSRLLTFGLQNHDNVRRNYKSPLLSGTIRSSAVPCGRKRKKHKIATHKRKKKLRMMRHKKK
jgi:hypothetical protein